MDFQAPEGSGGLLGVIAVAILTALGIWRKQSKTSLDVKKDKIEGDGLQLNHEQLVKRLEEAHRDRVDAQEERDKWMAYARDAWKKQLEDAERIGALEAQNNNQREKIAELLIRLNEQETRVKELVEAVRQLGPRANDLVENSGFGALKNKDGS